MFQGDNGPEQFLPEDTEPVDVVGWRAFEAISQRASRRGFLAKTGRLAFAVLGVSVATELLPIGRAQAAVIPCSDYSLCGFCGTQCGCSNCSGDIGSCPSCACIGGSWTACCVQGGGVRRRFRYKDCFRVGDTVNGPCSQNKFNNCRSCRRCCGGQYPPPDPPGGGPYYNQNPCSEIMCTTVNLVEAC